MHTTTGSPGARRARWARFAAAAAASAAVAVSAVVATSQPAAAADTSEAYAAAVVASKPTIYWRFEDLPGATSPKDSSGRNTSSKVYSKTLTFSTTGKFGKALTLSGTKAAVISTERLNNPTAYSETVWFRSAGTNTNGRIIGFGKSGDSLSAYHDRAVQMNKDGRIQFTADPKASVHLVSPQTYNDGNWHQVVASQGPQGMKLYMDGKLVAQNSVAGARAYEGYWRVGFDYPYTGASGYMMLGQLDEAAFYDRVLTDAEVASIYDASLPATAPTAAIQATVADLSLGVDGSDSTAIAGRSITGYAWDFGDGTTGTGRTAQHAYARAGTYTVTLVVTDNTGATGTAATTITATAPAPSPTPTAVIDVSTSELKAVLDGSRSSSPDGSPIVSYAWDFGDRSTGTGAAVNHTYAASGQYNVTLTVTNAAGQTGTTTKTVAIVAQAPIAYDTWGRTSTTSWGTANVGGAWNTASGLAIEGAGVGTMTFARTGETIQTYLSKVSARDVDLTVDVSFDALPGGNGTMLGAVVRKSDAGDYRAKLVASPEGMVVNLVRYVGTTETILASAPLPDAYVPGQVLKVRFQAIGAGTTTLQAKVWPANSAEPGAWQVATTDATPALQSAGAVGLAGYVSSQAPSLDGQKIRVDNLRVVAP